MFYLISGGSGSGKSVFAEQKAVELHKKRGTQELYYIATMQAYDCEAQAKIKRHRRQRSGKGFETIECYHTLSDVELKKNSTVLLDCLSNLVANEMFSLKGGKERTASAVLEGIEHICNQCENLIVVTNEIFSDGGQYDTQTLEYIRYMGEIHCEMAKKADWVIEVVYGIPLLRAI